MALIVSWLLSSFFVSAQGPGQLSCMNLFTPLAAVRGAEEFAKHPRFFRYLDRTYSFVFEANLSDAGIVFFEAYLNRGSRNIRSVHTGRELYAQMMEHFGVENVIGVSGVWMGGTNLSQYYSFRAMGDSPQQAAAKTWSGRLALEYGFTEVHIIDAGGTVPGLPNIKKQVEVIFLRKNQTSR
jgi:hypothetical protein